MNVDTQADNATVLTKMRDAINAHDIDAFMSCFADDYTSEQPIHPARAFGGTEQVRKNWSGFFADVPDLEAELVAATIDGELSWSEWHWQGTRTSGGELNMRGVVVAGLREGVICWARLYMEPVQTA